MIDAERLEPDEVAGEREVRVEAVHADETYRFGRPPSPPDPDLCYAFRVNQFDDRSILPPDPDGLEALHDREYRVRAFRLADDRLLIRGAVRDQKPPGLYFEDTQALTVHHMQVEIEVAFPSLEIVEARVLFETHPHATCPAITEHYGKLIGLSIARGFTHKVRELFGGPRGCTHTTALLQAMAPVAVQCFWSMRASIGKRGDGEPAAEDNAEQRRAIWATNLNTCHVWAEDGEHVREMQNGGQWEVPLFVQRRMTELGRDPQQWHRPAG